MVEIVMCGFGKPPRAPKGQLADPNVARSVGLARLTHHDVGKAWWVQEHAPEAYISGRRGPAAWACLAVLAIWPAA